MLMSMLISMLNRVSVLHNPNPQNSESALNYLRQKMWFFFFLCLFS